MRRFMQVLGALLPQLSTMIQGEPKTAEFCGELLKFATAPYRAGRSLDGAIDKMIEQFKAKDPAKYGEIEAAAADRGGQGDGIAFGFDEHVLQDRHRRAAADDVGHARETVEKVIPVNLELHDDVRIEQRRGLRQPLIAHNLVRTVSILSSFINTRSISRGRKSVHSSARCW